MADRIIKSDSGNDVVIQNNGGTRKIEVTDSGDVEVTGDFKATTVKATNLKANDGTASLEIADSTGDIGFSGNTNLKIKLPSAGGIYESDGSTEILTESSGTVTLKNTTIDSTVTISASNIFQAMVLFEGSSSSPITATTSFNVSSIVRNAAGRYRVHWDTDFSNTNYYVLATAGRFATGVNRNVTIEAIATTHCDLNIRNFDDQPLDTINHITVVAFTN